MRVGVFADSHDHVDNVRRVVHHFNAIGCEYVFFAGDFVSPLVVPPLRKLNCRMFACFGDNDGNRRGILSGMSILGGVSDAPVCVKIKDGTRFLLTHILNDVRDCVGDADVVIFAHSHRSSVVKDANGKLFVNPGETGGWTYRKPTVAVVETDTLEGTIVSLPELPPLELPYTG